MYSSTTISTQPQTWVSLRHSGHCPRARVDRKYFCIAASVRHSKRAKYTQERVANQPLLINILPDATDLWRLDPVVDLINRGAVGIIPTDSLPAVVCDLENKNAVARLYQIQNLKPTKLLSIMVRSFSDISKYTMGFSVSNLPGQMDGFHLVKKVLPGPYTIILNANKAMPKQCIDYISGKSKHRKSVGVRMSADPVCRALMGQLPRPLLCSSVHTEEDRVEDGIVELPDPPVMFDIYAPRGIDFMVTTGQTVFAEESTILDMTTAIPEIIREGKGDVEIFRQKEFARQGDADN